MIAGFLKTSPLANDQTGCLNRVSIITESKNEFGWLQASNIGPSLLSNAGLLMMTFRQKMGSTSRAIILIKW